MEFDVFVGDVCVASGICGCEFVGEVCERAKALAAVLEEPCALVSVDTGEVVALWYPTP